MNQPSNTASKGAPPPPSLDEVIELLIRLPILTESEGRSVHQRALDRGLTVEQVLQGLEHVKRVTTFQSKVILGGKGKTLRFGPFVLMKLLGKGGMGTVYQAKHRENKRIVAVKVMSEKASSQNNLRRFLRESRTAIMLEHPNIVGAYSAGTVGNVHYMEMELVQGQDLSALIKEKGPLSYRKALNYTLDAARGLHYAHEQGIIHRDIKPANLFLHQERTVKVLDMGLARFDPRVTDVSEHLTRTGQVLGTINYMSPEQATDGKNIDHRTDIYSLGCTLYYFLAAKPPYKLKDRIRTLMSHQQAPIPSLRAVNAALPRSADLLLQRMMAKNPNDRYKSMQPLIRDLETLLGQSGG